MLIFSVHIVKVKKSSHMGGFFCAHSLQVIDFWHEVKWNIADSSLINFYKITEKSNKKLLNDIYYHQLPWKIGIFLMHHEK